MKTTNFINKMFLIPMLILVLGLALVNCGDGDDDKGDEFNLYETVAISNEIPNVQKFASSVGVNGNWAVAGYGVDVDYLQFNLYHYTNSTWSSKDMESVYPAANLPTDIIVSVDISDSYIIGGISDLSDTNFQGVVMLFTNEDGSPFSRGAATNFGQFGFSVAISGTSAIVGAPGSDTVYFYDITSGALNLHSSFSSNSDNFAFGHSVDIDGDYAVVGAYGQNNTNGSAYVYRHEGDGSWTNIDELSKPNNFSNYGVAVAICGNNAIVGINDADANAAIFHFDGVNWYNVRTMYGRGNIVDYVTVAISSNYALVGVVEGGRGTVQIYKNNSGSWTYMGEHFGEDNMTVIGLALDDYRMVVGQAGSSENWVHFYE